MWARRQLSWGAGGTDAGSLLPVGCALAPRVTAKARPRQLLRLWLSDGLSWPGMWPTDGCGSGSALARRLLRAGRGHLGGQQTSLAWPRVSSGCMAPVSPRPSMGSRWAPLLETRLDGELSVSFPRYLRGQMGSRLGFQQLSRCQFPGGSASDAGAWECVCHRVSQCPVQGALRASDENRTWR